MLSPPLSPTGSGNEVLAAGAAGVASKACWCRTVGAGVAAGAAGVATKTVAGISPPSHRAYSAQLFSWLAG